MVNYKEARVKLTNNQLKKLESAAKHKSGTTLTITKKFQDEEFPHELFLAIRQKTDIRGFLVALLGKFVDQLMKVAAPLPKSVLAPLSIMMQ